MIREAIILVIVLITSTFVVNTIQANENTEMAVVITEFSCLMGDGNNPPNLFETAASNQIVETSKGNYYLRCRANNVDNPSKKIVKWNFETTGGVRCSYSLGEFSGETEDWEEIITPSGQATLSCHWNPNPIP